MIGVDTCMPPGEDDVSESSVSDPDMCKPLSAMACSKLDELVDAR